MGAAACWEPRKRQNKTYRCSRGAYSDVSMTPQVKVAISNLPGQKRYQVPSRAQDSKIDIQSLTDIRGGQRLVRSIAWLSLRHHSCHFLPPYEDQDHGQGHGRQQPATSACRAGATWSGVRHNEWDMQSISHLAGDGICVLAVETMTNAKHWGAKRNVGGFAIDPLHSWRKN